MVLLPAWCLILVLAAPLSVVSSAFAQGRTAIRAGWLVDVEQGEVRRDQVILVRDGRSPEAFSGARNASATLLAGFTAVRDIGTYRAFVDVALRDAISNGTVMGRVPT